MLPLSVETDQGGAWRNNEARANRINANLFTRVRQREKVKYRSHGGSEQVHVLATPGEASVLCRKINYRATWFLWVLLAYPDARGSDVSQTLHLELIPNKDGLVFIN